MDYKLTLYHGSNHKFDAVDLSKSLNKRDFGRGFYMTTIRKQAEDWATVMYLRNGGGKYLYIFEFEFAETLAIKEYDGLTREWLEQVKQNRIEGGITHQFDVMMGPVANDNTMRVVNLYVTGDLSAEAALIELSYFEANDQVSIHTPAALEHLTLLERIELE